ncbi:MAG TPA: tryptophan halogenase family protein [Rhodanobacter sp.]|nr:tryptophan halogenase family protein [Rhodanobacter sp.]
MPRMKKILVVGGGTAGWLTACYLAKALNSVSADSIQVELVESPNIGALGVGEGTFPSIRGTLAAIGLDERRFFVGAAATFKQGVHFVDWVRPASEPGQHHYFHPFNHPSQRSGNPELLPYWLLGAAPADMPYAEAVSMQQRVVQAGRAPKRMTDGNYLGPMNYAYHFDAACFAKVLAEHGQGLGVKRQLATVEHAELDQQGAIACVVTRELGALSADLYIDCTGLRGTLIGGAMQSPMRSLRDVLFCDRAVAVQVPDETPDAPIRPYTVSTAQEAGWIWDIGLQRRRGTGYVYSSQHTEPGRAEEVIRGYLGRAAEKLDARHIKFDPGYRPEPWRHNCVAVGLSGGVVEPLESTGIALVELGAYLITHLLPGDSNDMSRTARQYNEMMSARYERILDFIKMHYCISQRRDSRFWLDNVDPASIPDTLRDRLALWRHRPPHRLDFVTDLEMFLPASWQYILYGMEFKTDLEPMRSAYAQMEVASREFATIRQMAGHAINDLPDHRALVEQLLREHAPRAEAGPGEPVRMRG